MGEDDIEIEEKVAAYQGYFRLDRYRLRHRLHDGGWSDVLVREVFERGHVAAVLPYDPARDEVVLIEQFRPGAYAAGRAPWLIEAVAGIIEPGETAAEVARRETMEEAGIEVGDLLPIADYLSSPGAMSESVMLYCGRVDAEGAGGVHGLGTEHEDIRVLAVPFAEARRMLEAGEIVNAITLIALQWLVLHRDEVRRRWGGA